MVAFVSAKPSPSVRPLNVAGFPDCPVQRRFSNKADAGQAVKSFDNKLMNSFGYSTRSLVREGTSSHTSTKRNWLVLPYREQWEAARFQQILASFEVPTILQPFGQPSVSCHRGARLQVF